jgi:hypothetical protein
MLLVSGRLPFAAAMTMSCETRSTTGNDRAWLSSPSYGIAELSTSSWAQIFPVSSLAHLASTVRSSEAIGLLDRDIAFHFRRIADSLYGLSF